MNSSNKTIAIIPARGGSKGVPKKNLRQLAGKPLMAWTIEAALMASGVDRVVVSTDSVEIADVAKEYGAEAIMRPKELAEDWSPSEEALLHALHVAGGPDKFEAVIFLQATSPLRTYIHVEEAVGLFRDSSADSLLSVFPSHIFLWEERQGQATPILFDYGHRPMRQEMTNQFQENGAIYVFKPEVLLKGKNRLGGKIVMYQMPEHASLDIDTEIDLILADILLKRKMETGSDY